MKRNKIKFQIISPPAEDEIISAIMDHACARLSNVNEQTIQATKPHAEKVKLVFMVMPSQSVIVCTCFSSAKTKLLFMLTKISYIHIGLSMLLFNKYLQVTPLSKYTVSCVSGGRTHIITRHNKKTVPLSMTCVICGKPPLTVSY